MRKRPPSRVRASRRRSSSASAARVFVRGQYADLLAAIRRRPWRRHHPREAFLLRIIIVLIKADFTRRKKILALRDALTCGASRRLRPFDLLSRYRPVRETLMMSAWHLLFHLAGTPAQSLLFIEMRPQDIFANEIHGPTKQGTAHRQ